MLSQSNPAVLYIFSGESWSKNLSGKIIDLNFKPLSKNALSDSNLVTWDPNPPIEPSSIVIIAFHDLMLIQ